MLTHGNLMTELAVAVHELEELFAPTGSDGASTLLFLPLAHVFARVIQVGAVKARVRLGHSRRRQEPRPRPRAVPPHVRAGGATGLREGLQHRLPERHGRRAGQDLRPRRRGGGRLVARHRSRQEEQALAGRAGAARGVLPAGLRTAARRARRAVRVRRLGWRPAGRAARSLLPRHRPGRPRGLRADRDHRPPSRSTPRTRRRSGPSAARCPGRRSASPTTASCSSAAARCSPATGTTRPPPPRCSSATAGSTPVTSARSTTRASSASPGARRRSW